MYKQEIFSVAIVVLLVIALALWSSSCKSGDSGTGPGGGGGGRLSASPTSVSVPVNGNAFVNVSGGTANYAVQTSPDTSIATVSLINNTMGSPPAAIATITVHGVRADSAGTSTTIKDGSFPARTVTVPIRVTP